MSRLGGSIVQRLVLITLTVGILTAAIGVTIVQVLERRELVAETLTRDLGAAERTATRIDDRLLAIREQLGLIAAQPATTELGAAASRELEIALRIATDLDELILYDGDGRPVAGAATSSLLRVRELPARPELDTEALNTERWADEGDLPTLEITVPVENPPGTIVGILLGRVPIGLVAREATTQLTASSGTTFLTDDEGTIRAHPELDRVLDREHFDVSVFAQQATHSTTIGGRPTIVVGSALQAVPAWVVIEQPRSEVIQPAAVTLSGFTGVFLAVVAAIVTAVILTGRHLLRPLGPLAGAVERVGRGELDVRVAQGGQGERDEVAVLGRGFNDMARSLEARQAQLEDAERAARHSEERLRLMVEGVTDYAIFLMGPDGRIESWNTGGHRLLGHDTDEALGQPLTLLLGPDAASPESPAESTARLMADASRQDRAHFEGWCRRRDGTIFWAQLTVTALPHGGETDGDGYVVIIHDLTDQRLARTALENALQREQHAAVELRHAAELKDEFLAIAAHEIRTPLSAILGATKLLTDGEDTLNARERRRFHAMIGASADDMRDIVERLLDFTRLQAGQVRFVPQRFELRAALEGHVRLLERQLHDHDVTLDAAVTEVATDRELLRHVVTNLVVNAATFSPAGSAITITACVEGDVLVLRVRDEGAGIAVEDHERIFELFRQSAKAGSASSGTGVGLAIVKRYVELVDGEIGLDSTPGEGSTFTIRLPLTADPSGAPTTPGPVGDVRGPGQGNGQDGSATLASAD